jgi:hypothetical protein
MNKKKNGLFCAHGVLLAGLSRRWNNAELLQEAQLVEFDLVDMVATLQPHHPPGIILE